MTSRSLKKRPTTARMFPQEIRSKHNPLKHSRRRAIFVAACRMFFTATVTATLSSGLAVSTASAQGAGHSYPVSQTTSTTDTAWHGNPGYRPVPKVRSSEIAPSTTSVSNGTNESRRPGWNLQWRTSPQVTAEQARQISDAAFEQPPVPISSQPETQAPKIIATAANRSRNEAITAPAQGMAAQPNRLREAAPGMVQRVAWMTQQTETPQGGFSLPGNIGELPSPMELPSPAPESIPRPSADKLQDLFGEGPATNPPSSGSQPSADAPSIRDMLQDEPTVPRRDENQPGGRSPLRPMEPSDKSSDTEQSPSDRDTFAPNPFGNRSREAAKEKDERAERDARDRARRQRGEAPSIFNLDEEGPANSGTGLSCEDFRDRIRIATIDQVSLDPSPPFRPDVIDDTEFEKLKGKFSEKQKARTWRSIDGRPLGTGRLEDLAYEKAIIVTKFGSREELPLNRLSEADLVYISENWGLPTECLIEQVAYTPRSWTPTTMTYTASNLCHKPLYFEEVNLERYGHTAGPLAQPFISSAHFFLNIAVLPYKMGVHSPHECQYALGYYRPGNCAPWIIPPVPLSVRGAWYQAAAVTGTALLIP